LLAFVAADFGRGGLPEKMARRYFRELIEGI
jgi:hypothetical protein